MTKTKRTIIKKKERRDTKEINSGEIKSIGEIFKEVKRSGKTINSKGIKNRGETSTRTEETLQKIDLPNA